MSDLGALRGTWSSAAVSTGKVPRSRACRGDIRSWRARWSGRHRLRHQRLRPDRRTDNARGSSPARPSRAARRAYVEKLGMSASQAAATTILSLRLRSRPPVSSSVPGRSGSAATHVPQQLDRTQVPALDPPDRSAGDVSSWPRRRRLVRLRGSARVPAPGDREATRSRRTAPPVTARVGFVGHSVIFGRARPYLLGA